jgi:hypothetical protein
MTKDEVGNRDRAYASIEILRAYVEKFRVNHNLTCALLNQCALELTSPTVSLQKKHKRELFLANIAEYFFENLWQDDKRHFTQDNYLFYVY